MFLLVGVSIGAQQVFAMFVDFTSEDIHVWVSDFGVFGPLAYIGALIVSIVFSPLPTAALAVGAGLAWGTFLGTLYTLIGGCIGGVICFLLARRYGRPFVAKRISPSTMEYIDRMAVILGARLIFLMRMIPVFGFEWVSYAAGLTKMRLTTFTTWTVIGSILPILAITYVGENLDEDPLKSAIVFGGLILVALAALVYFAMRRQPVLANSVERVKHDRLHERVKDETPAA